MSKTLDTLLAEGDELIREHREQLPILALEWVKAQDAPGAADIAAMMESLTPVVYFDVAFLTTYPSGKVVYSLDRGLVSLGIITFYVNQDPNDLGISGIMEILTSRGRYERQPIEDITHDWLVVALKRSEAINS